ncbi:MAG TPA: protein translocase subunit SecDF [Paludibacteraceae bacterium]|nr:protein translocase subunit SecDF [Paludibacteraceae bacterium]
MQNKGFVKFFSVLLTLVCLFYLSFSIVSRYYENKAEKLYGSDVEKQTFYLDSLAGQKVWLGYTLKECREQELNLGLDLKGGMNVVMEVSVADILKSLAGNNATNENFAKAITSAKQKQKIKQADFVDLFYESFKEADAKAKLADVFSTFELKDKINGSTPDEEVIKVLKAEVKSAVDNSFNVLRSRIDRFGVVQPNIQQLEIAGRILIEMPGIKEPERVRKLLQGSADLEFWETANFADVYQSVIAVNNLARDLNGLKSDDNKAEADSSKATAEKADTTASATDSLLAKMENKQDTAAKKDANFEEYAKQNPLFAIFTPNMDQQGQIGYGATMGRALVKDTAKVSEMFRMAKEKNIFLANIYPKWSVKAIDKGETIYELVAIKSKRRDGKAPLTGSVITDAKADFGKNSSAANVSMEMNPEGAKTWARLTKENIGNQIAIVLDGYVYSYPRVNTEITGGRSEITGNFTVEEAKDLANVLKSGKMAAPAKIIQEDVVGPSLGQEAINDGLISFIIAFALVLLYMIAYYGLIPGLIADIALLANVFFIFSVLASFKAVLTLPGIAGVVLTLGMAVDANVLIYERTREELRTGKQIWKAVADGYGNAFSAIIDSNVTTILTGIILFVFGTGPIRGFATTLIIGITCSFFTAIFITRLIYDWLLKKEKYQNLTFTTNFTKNWFQNVHFDFIGKRKTFYILSLAFVAIALTSLAVQGLKPGIDFSGGRNYIVRFENPVNTVDVSNKLDGKFGEDHASVITIGEANQVRISTNYKIEDESENIDNEIETILYDNLKEMCNSNVTKELFVHRYVKNGDNVTAAGEDGETTFGIQSSQKVGPTMADDIKTAAYWAVILAVIAIGLYILVRFRNIAFSVGAVASLAHDALFILGIYSLLYTIVPFSMEVDQSFIAAILTVIGYSINDTVVIFDRIRENLHLYPGRDNKEVFNTSMNTTLGRTFSTSMSTLVVLIAIFLFGGETIRGFIFAMLIGIIVGTYSTLFIASPIAYDIATRKKKKVENK